MNVTRHTGPHGLRRYWFIDEPGVFARLTVEDDDIQIDHDSIITPARVMAVHAVLTTYLADLDEGRVITAVQHIAALTMPFTPS